MRFYDQTGTVHIEGVLIDNSGDGITIQAPDAVFQIQNVRISNNHQYRDDFSDGHPDLIQTWSGPKEVRIDRFTGYSDYQGLTWLNAGDGHVYPGRVTATNVNIAPLAPQPDTLATWPDGSTRDKPDLGAGVWHVSPSTVFSCSSCYLTTGWWSQSYRRKLDDSIGGYMTGDGQYNDPYYELHGADGASYQSPSSPTGGVNDATNPVDLGRRQGDTMTSPRTPNLANETWTWGAPAERRLRPRFGSRPQLRLTRLQLAPAPPASAAPASSPCRSSAAHRPARATGCLRVESDRTGVLPFCPEYWQREVSVVPGLHCLLCFSSVAPGRWKVESIVADGSRARHGRQPMARGFES